MSLTNSQLPPGFRRLFTGSRPSFADFGDPSGPGPDIVGGAAKMSRQELATTTGAVVMLGAALLAGAIVSLIATDPLGIATLTTTGDVLTLLGRAASRVVDWF